MRLSRPVGLTVDGALKSRQGVLRGVRRNRLQSELNENAAAARWVARAHTLDGIAARAKESAVTDGGLNVHGLRSYGMVG